jgi:choline dehydrogenase
MYVNSLAPGAAFDYVVVGAGSAGCAVAARLSEDPGKQVLLIEAGGRDRDINIHIPMMVAKLLKDERLTWPFMTEPQPQLNGKAQLWARGKVLGGCSSINGNLFVRGDPAEYDTWRDQGCVGWSYQDLLPVFKRLEDYPEGDPASRGRGGAVGCKHIERFDELADAFVDACEQSGYARVADYNDGDHYEGAFYLQYSTRNGLRSSAAVAYLKPAKNRPNLTVLTEGTVTRVTLDGKRATGVECATGGARQVIRARREVILCAGPLQSPKLLELSGIGNAEILEGFGIAAVHHLPSVGENLRDHPNVRTTYQCAKPITINDVLRSPVKKLREGLRFVFKREGLLTICSATAAMNYRANPGAARPDMVVRLHPLSGKDRYARTPQLGLDPFPGFSFGVAVLQPRSIGTLHISSPDPFVQARMDPRYLSHEADAQMFVEGVRLSRKLADAPAFKPLVVRETRPGVDAQDDAAILDYVKSSAQTSWHMCGTCKMGVDEQSVVDPQLKVRGIDGLRVADSSIFPTIPSSNTNIPSILVGEKAADLIKAGSRP